MLRRRTLTSPRLRKKKRSVILRRTLLGGALFISLFLGVRLVINSDIFTIKSIEVIGARDVESNEIKSLVSSEIDTSKFGLFSKRNFLFIDTKNITALVEEAFPDFSKVRTTLAGLGSLVIEVIERAPYAKWCYKLDNKECLVIDDKGFAFEKDKTKVATTTLNIFTESEPVYATEIFENNKFVKLKQFINYFNKAGFTIYSVTESNTDYFMKTFENLEIRIKSGDSPDSIVTKLIAIQNDLKKEDNTASIDYIDLRYGNKVFLKRH